MLKKEIHVPVVPQDLHIHTTFSTGDSAVVPEQTVEFVASVGHARSVGISDHFEYLVDTFDIYRDTVKKHGLYLGTEVDGAALAGEAAGMPFEYYMYHCRNTDEDYRGLEVLLATGRPVIVAHPQVFETDLSKVPPETLIEINNRYVWRNNWRRYYTPWLGSFNFVIGSDAHQPGWLGQVVARHVAVELGVEEHLVFG